MNVISRATKINEVKNFLPLLTFMKRPQTKFHAYTRSDFLDQKKSKFASRSKFIGSSNLSCSTVSFSSSIFYWNDNR